MPCGFLMTSQMMTFAQPWSQENNSISMGEQGAVESRFSTSGQVLMQCRSQMGGNVDMNEKNNEELQISQQFDGISLNNILIAPLITFTDVDGPNRMEIQPASGMNNSNENHSKGFLNVPKTNVSDEARRPPM